MRRFLGSTVLVLALILMVGWPLVSSPSAAAEYDQDVLQHIPHGYAWVLSLNLTAGEYVHLNLKSTQYVDFLFMTSLEYGEKWTRGIAPDTLANLSLSNALRIDQTAQVPNKGGWWLVVDNTRSGFNATVDGHLRASQFPETSFQSFYLAVGIVAAAAAAVVALTILAFKRKPKGIQKP